ncbi:hypothetical protein OSTOST_08091, partial [Ostertagia ostertagi]
MGGAREFALGIHHSSIGVKRCPTFSGRQIENLASINSIILQDMRYIEPSAIPIQKEQEAEKQRKTPVAIRNAARTRSSWTVARNANQPATWLLRHALTNVARVGVNVKAAIKEERTAAGFLDRIASSRDCFAEIYTYQAEVGLLQVVAPPLPASGA